MISNADRKALRTPFVTGVLWVDTTDNNAARIELHTRVSVRDANRFPDWTIEATTDESVSFTYTIVVKDASVVNATGRSAFCRDTGNVVRFGLSTAVCSTLAEVATKDSKIFPNIILGNDNDLLRAAGLTQDYLELVVNRKNRAVTIETRSTVGTVDNQFGLATAA